MTGSCQLETQQPQPDDTEITRDQVQALIQSARKASEAGDDIILPRLDDGTDLDQAEKEEDDNLEPGYWETSGMAPLNATSLAAVARLRAFKPPPFPLWDRIHTSRKAAVLLLLYADRRGDLRVVITMRAASLRSFSGHAALPGGKADTPEETPYQIARREAFEEIGLPMDDAKLPAPFRIEHLCYLPINLARTELLVRPCVALLHTTATGPAPAAPPEVQDTLIPRLDAKEVAAVFSAPFHNFLLADDEAPAPAPPPGQWYHGEWTHWNDEAWRVHYFGVPVRDQRVVKPRRRRAEVDAEAAGELEGEEPGRYKVWGMTARILVDAATIAYAETPEFEHNTHFGDERMILEIEKLGRLKPKVRAGEEKKEGGEGGKKVGEAESKM
ncbi:peroxisomal peroxisomal coenzyme A diphosphatase 1 [Podospora conica]|nr:peroxisomal peroxisomal coenzyme A diphosphatase 1 [Schizothecium conicum]